jgi:hypothetical protein
MTPEQINALFMQLNGTPLLAYLEFEIARLQAQLCEQTESVAIFRTQGGIQTLSRMRKLLEASRRR